MTNVQVVQVGMGHRTLLVGVPVVCEQLLIGAAGLNDSVLLCDGQSHGWTGAKSRGEASVRHQGMRRGAWVVTAAHVEYGIRHTG